MKDPTLAGFADHMMSWLDPDKILNVVSRLSEDIEGATAKSELLLAAQYISPESDGGLRGLVEAFLKRFRVPRNVILLLRQLDRQGLPEKAWNLLGSLRFKGQILIPPPGIDSPIGTPILLIRDSDAVIDLVSQPLAAIQGTVALMAQNWFQMRDAGIGKDRVWLRHGSPDPIGAWMDGYVAKSSGFSRIAQYEHITWEYSPHFRYRAISLVGWSGPNDKELEIAREIAQKTAATTREPRK